MAGTNCNIPTACPTGFYGEVCNYKCHCENKGPCDKTSGVCSNNKCAAGWINTDIPDCQQDGTKTSIQSLKYVKVNPGEETSITCEVFGNPFSWSDELTLRDLSEPDTSIPSKVTRMSGKYTYFANFSINTEDVRRYSLSLKSGSSKQITVTQYVLPRFSSNNLPNVSVDASTATVRWQRWSATDDLGDGPIQAYMVYYKRSADADWILHENVDAGDSSTSTYSSVITGLDWSTRYDVTVTLKRPGPKGEGSKESFVTVTTLCDEPTEEPVILNVTSPDPHTLKIDIQIPDPSTIRCHDRGYINHMSVKYKKSDTLSDYEQTIVSGHSFGNDVVEGVVDGLLAYTEYDVLVSFYNFHKQSPWSSVYKARTAEDVPSPPRNVTVEATVAELKVNWLIPDPTNGVIDKYEIQYWKTGDPVFKKVGIMMEDLRITNSFLITNLTYKSNYTIQVQASTSAGLGPPSQALVIQTTDILPGPPGSLEVQEINDNSITITWTEPITFAGDIQNYGVSYHSIESVFKTLANTSMSFTLDGTTTKPFYDTASDCRDDELYRTNQNTATIKLPQLAKDTTLSQDTKFIDYIVVVDRGENAAIPKKTFNAKMLYHNETRTVNASYYVAASFALTKIPSTFVLGDNGQYGGFNNSPLDFGIQYYIYYGLRSDITGSYVFYMPENPLLSIKDCAIGKYGPICNKTCHCAVGCNIETGKCNMGLCEQEWSGSKCHIPDFCEAGYYGELCDQNCHCSRNSECDRNTSVCSNGQCAPGWIDVDTDGCQQDGSKKIRSLHSLKVNPGEETYIVCEATANPVIEPKDLILLDLSVHSHVNLTDWYISKKYVFVANFSIIVYSHTLYALAIAGGPSQGIAVDLYDLPRFSPSNLPNVSVDASTATVRWQRWSATNDLGDGPIQAYIVYYKLSTDVHWILHENIDVADSSTSTYSSVITGLDWSTRYDVTVTLKRPGPRGECSKESYRTVTTLCDVPDQGPSIISTESTTPEIINIKIEVPVSSQVKCIYNGVQGYIDSLLVKYREANTQDDYVEIVMRNTSVRVLALSGLFAYTKYQLLVSFRNKDQQSPWSQEYMAWTAEDVPSIPRNVTVRAGADSMTIQWLVPEPCNGLINEYKIRYWEIAKPSQNHTLIITANLGDINTATVFNLTHKAHYKVQVQASTGAGLGEFTDVMSVQTSDQKKDKNFFL
ncbi:protein sidekick-2-like [Ptychodera flava]|uniref:protein sidekick-2-like n=1 Tax=Ptychodera flava TaxID=63121 RepID=UPI00396A674C